MYFKIWKNICPTFCFLGQSSQDVPRYARIPDNATQCVAVSQCLEHVTHEAKRRAAKKVIKKVRSISYMSLRVVLDAHSCVSRLVGSARPYACVSRNSWIPPSADALAHEFVGWSAPAVGALCLYKK